MSLTIENLKFTIFGSGYDGTNNDSGTGGDIDPPTPPSPPMQGYLFRYGQMRPMETYKIALLNTASPYAVDFDEIDYTGGLCFFKMQSLPKDSSLPTFVQVKAWIESVTNKNGAASANSHVGRIYPLSRTDMGGKIIGIVCHYLDDNPLYKTATWCEYDPDLGHWTTPRNTFFIISASYDDVADDNTMTYTLINDGTYFSLALHHSTPQVDQIVGGRFVLADYDFYYWS